VNTKEGGTRGERGRNKVDIGIGIGGDQSCENESGRRRVEKKRGVQMFEVEHLLSVKREVRVSL